MLKPAASRRLIIAGVLLFAACAMSSAQTVSVKDTLMRTYPYGDPDPVPHMGKIYPYWRFQQFTKNGEDRTWKMIVLENEYLRVKVFPEIGGKVWSIYDKTDGKELFYDNDVVKFREIALRGPWTSGGIEFNYGVIGHAPSCASPVDWKIEKKADGSVSCYIGVFEMLSRSHWTVEVNLPEDAAYVRTTSTWHNESSEYQPFYSWANSGVKTSDDAVFIYPSRNAIGHSGEKLSYPVSENGLDLSIYGNQAYGDSKSYHMVGSHKPFFGTYYPSEDYGVMHWSVRDEKLGRKYFTWAQSESGNIWIDLLTDSRPQYIEMQSGKLFNQNTEDCSRRSAYRQMLFTPYGTEQWSDYWLPFAGIGPADNVTLDAVTSVSKVDGNTVVGIYPLRPLKGGVTVADASGRVLYKGNETLSPTKPVTVEVKGEPASVCAGGRTIWRADDETVDRPQDRNPEFDPESPAALVMLARDYVGMRKYAEAEQLVDKALASEPAMLQAMDLKAFLLYRKMDYAGAYACSDKALSIDQYDPDAGYIGGLAAVALGKYADAMDRFEVGVITNGPLRSSAFTELARLHFKRGDKELAADYARKAMICNGNNATAMSILYKVSGKGLEDIAALNPLSHFVDAEKFLSGSIDAAAFAGTFKGEIPWEDYLELAVFYHSLGLDCDAVKVLETLPSQNALTAIWTAYLKDDVKALPAACSSDVSFVFPFRSESYAPLKWAVDNCGGWKPSYLLAMLEDFLGNRCGAGELLQDNSSDYAPYYAYRYGFTNDRADIEKAFSLDPEGWRYCKALASDLVSGGKAPQAVSVLEKFYAEHPDNVQIGDALIDAYIAADMLSKAGKVVDKIEYLPFEGLRGSHDKYRHIKLHLAAAAIDKGQLSKAGKLVEEALLWPDRLGAGKPYDNMIDTSVEDWLKSEIDARRTGKGPHEAVSPKLGNFLSVDKKLF